MSPGAAEELRGGEVTWATLSNAAHICTEVAKATMNGVLINDKIGSRRSSYLLKTVLVRPTRDLKGIWIELRAFCNTILDPA